jgi:hypothetical protein
MSCPTSEQLTAAALGLDDSNTISHIDHCGGCQTKLADLRRVSYDLAAAHAKLDHDHALSRNALLSAISRVEYSSQSVATWKRFAFGGIGLSSAAALLLLAFFATSANQLSAMERIVNAVRDVTSLSCKITHELEKPPNSDRPARTLSGDLFICWRKPPDAEPDQFGDYRGVQVHEWVYHLPTGDQGPEVTMDIVEVHPSGKPGALFDNVAKKYRRIPPLESNYLPATPLVWLRAVREKAGRIVEDLGTRQIRGRDARGYVMTFDGVAPFDHFGPVEVWIDPQNDLPMEFSLHYAKADEGFTDRFTVTDIQWNAELDPKLFDTTPPPGFLDITLPEDKRSVTEIIDALKLYAELSGGRYPHVEKVRNGPAIPLTRGFSNRAPDLIPLSEFSKIQCG